MSENQRQQMKSIIYDEVSFLSKGNKDTLAKYVKTK